jgi:hypothetical protein
LENRFGCRGKEVGKEVAGSSTCAFWLGAKWGAAAAPPPLAAGAAAAAEEAVEKEKEVGAEEEEEEAELLSVGEREEGAG